MKNAANLSRIHDFASLCRSHESFSVWAHWFECASLLRSSVLLLVLQLPLLLLLLHLLLLLPLILTQVYRKPVHQQFSKIFDLSRHAPKLKIRRAAATRASGSVTWQAAVAIIAVTTTALGVLEIKNEVWSR